MDTADETPAPTIRDLYPHYTDEQLAIAEDNLERYLKLVLRIYERLESQKAQQLTENDDALPCETSVINSS